jgi:hypothetical protein
MLPAVTFIDYESDNFDQHLETLSNLDSSAGISPIYYSWVNTTCHPEWLKHFEVDPFQVPSVVYYYPEKSLQANLIGKFDQETIEEQSDNFLRGKLASWANKNEIVMESKDCQLAELDSEQDEADKALEEEILREIMEEEAAKKSAE